MSNFVNSPVPPSVHPSSLPPPDCTIVQVCQVVSSIDQAEGSQINCIYFGFGGLHAPAQLEVALSTHIFFLLPEYLYVAEA